MSTPQATPSTVNRAIGLVLINLVYTLSCFHVVKSQKNVQAACSNL